MPSRCYLPKTYASTCTCLCTDSSGGVAWQWQQRSIKTERRRVGQAVSALTTEGEPVRSGGEEGRERGEEGRAPKRVGGGEADSKNEECLPLKSSLYLLASCLFRMAKEWEEENGLILCSLPILCPVRHSGQASVKVCNLLLGMSRAGYSSSALYLCMWPLTAPHIPHYVLCHLEPTWDATVGAGGPCAGWGGLPSLLSGRRASGCHRTAYLPLLARGASCLHIPSCRETLFCLDCTTTYVGTLRLSSRGVYATRTPAGSLRIFHPPRFVPRITRHYHHDCCSRTRATGRYLRSIAQNTARYGGIDTPRSAPARAPRRGIPTLPHRSRAPNNTRLIVVCALFIFR